VGGRCRAQGRGVWFALAGALALTGYGAVAALQPDTNFGRALVCIVGVAVIMCAPRGAS
jgi:small multidrug resistance family-3 protein